MKKALLFAINNYQGSENDLNGCLNDQEDLVKKLLASYSDFKISKFTDSAVTKQKVISEIDKAVKECKKGDTLIIHYSGHGTQVVDPNGDEKDGYDEALYLYDGPLVDDELNKSLSKLVDGINCVILLDSCFSGTATRKLGLRRRFLLRTGMPKSKRKRAIFTISKMKWLVFSGCKENETSADACFDNRYNGAFTYYFLKVLKKGITFQQIFDNLRKKLPNKKAGYDQTPTLEGNSTLKNTKF
jgi:metacaspase-1